MTSWKFGRSKRPEWILQPDVVIHSSSFDPYRTKHEFDKVLGVGEWKVDSLTGVSLVPMFDGIVN
ncbi:hypothetical protein N0V84_001195 [Fusarium piperis]|uniref:Uncharacterized protein n=1 Tax=Fusarium piperis TaxID=1435070 RepID=A0A9W9BTI1_9HYPO|nr:hypothetical protein N0V84_001195 [Fusarium piperis]